MRIQRARPTAIGPSSASIPVIIKKSSMPILPFVRHRIGDWDAGFRSVQRILPGDFTHASANQLTLFDYLAAQSEWSDNR